MPVIVHLEISVLFSSTMPCMLYMTELLNAYLLGVDQCKLYVVMTTYNALFRKRREWKAGVWVKIYGGRCGVFRSPPMQSMKAKCN